MIRSSILIVPTLLCLAGCASISGSFESSSDSSSGSLESLTSPFESSGTSSGSGGESVTATNYRRDVQSYTTAYLDDESAQGEYVRGLAQIAGIHGITNWEADENTLGAVREIVLDGRLDEVDIARLRVELAPLGEEVLRSTLDRES